MDGDPDRYSTQCRDVFPSVFMGVYTYNTLTPGNERVEMQLAEEKNTNLP